MLGGHIVGQDALIRFYALHVIVLPAVAVLMVSVHLWRVRKDGGLSCPDETGDVVQQIALDELPTNKSYGLMELARGTTPQVGKNPEDEVFSWPHLVFRELFLFLMVMAVVLFLAIFWNAPLEEFANPIHPPNPAKAPWYFLGLQELVSYSAFWGGVVVPGLLVSMLVLLPYIDRKPHGIGRWFARERVVAKYTFHFLPDTRHRADGHRKPVPRPELGVAGTMEKTGSGNRRPLTWTKTRFASSTPGSLFSDFWSAAWLF